jgi:hypothetical protein
LFEVIVFLQFFVPISNYANRQIHDLLHFCLQFFAPPEPFDT